MTTATMTAGPVRGRTRDPRLALALLSLPSRALEGTFLGGCLFSGRQPGRAAAAATAT